MYVALAVGVDADGGKDPRMTGVLDDMVVVACFCLNSKAFPENPKSSIVLAVYATQYLGVTVMLDYRW